MLMMASDWRIWLPVGFITGVAVSSIIIHLIHRQYLSELWQVRDECQKLRQEIKDFWDKPLPKIESSSPTKEFSEGKRKTMWG